MNVEVGIIGVIVVILIGFCLGFVLVLIGCIVFEIGFRLGVIWVSVI